MVRCSGREAREMYPVDNKWEGFFERGFRLASARAYPGPRQSQHCAPHPQGCIGRGGGTPPPSRVIVFCPATRYVLLLSVSGTITWKQQKARHQPQHTCSSALHHRCRLRRRNRISSSYSSSARNRTSIFRAAAGCTAAAVHGPKGHSMLSLRLGMLCLNRRYAPEAGPAAPSQPHYCHSLCSQINEHEPNTHTHY